MHKGFFTQAAVVLTERLPDAESVGQALGSFDVGRFKPAEDERSWMGGHPTWILAMNREVNRLVLVDLIDQPWPDAMGDPKGDPMLFGAWSMTHMGPFTWPGNLARAAQMTRASGRDALADAALGHRALIRIRSSYVLGADDNATILPPNYDALAELQYVTSVARAMVRVTGALCYFNPGGETLHSADGFDEILADCQAKDLPPLPIWMGHRFMRLDGAPGWMVADTLGMPQLDATDHEACYRDGAYKLGEVINFLRSVALYTFQKGPIIKTGQTADGPGGRWRAIEVERALIPGPRPALRWFPGDGSEPPASLRHAAPPAKEPEPPPATPRGRFSTLKSLFRR